MPITIAKTFSVTPIRHRFDTFMSDWYRIDVNPRVFVIMVGQDMQLLFMLNMSQVTLDISNFIVSKMGKTK